MMKRNLAIVLLTSALALTGCMGETTETFPEEENLEVVKPLEGNLFENSRQIEEFEFMTTYDAGDYDLSKWKITDSKIINVTAKVTNVPEGATILIEHVHIDMFIESQNIDLDSLLQGSMDAFYHGRLQDGYFISEKYPYEGKFSFERMDNYADVDANRVQVMYDILVKYEGDNFYHVVSVLDEFFIPVQQ